MVVQRMVLPLPAIPCSHRKEPRVVLQSLYISFISFAMNHEPVLGLRIFNALLKFVDGSGTSSHLTIFCCSLARFGQSRRVFIQQYTCSIKIKNSNLHAVNAEGEERCRKKNSLTDEKAHCVFIFGDNELIWLLCMVLIPMATSPSSFRMKLTSSLMALESLLQKTKLQLLFDERSGRR